MSDRDMFQGKCLVNAEGYVFMTGWFDAFPSSVRERLRRSPYNLCAACVSDIADRVAGDERQHPTSEHYFKAIEQMESDIRAEEANAEQPALHP